MLGKLVGTVVLFGALGHAPLAQAIEGGVARLHVCNHGGIAVDVFSAINSSGSLFLTKRFTIVENWHVAAGACEVVYAYSTSWGHEGERGDICFALVDSRGKWGTATVLRVPDFGSDTVRSSSRPFCIRRAKTKYQTESVS